MVDYLYLKCKIHLSTLEQKQLTTTHPRIVPFPKLCKNILPSLSTNDINTFPIK